jgi:hypothetical protein
MQDPIPNKNETSRSNYLYLIGWIKHSDQLADKLSLEAFKPILYINLQGDNKQKRLHQELITNEYTCLLFYDARHKCRIYLHNNFIKTCKKQNLYIIIYSPLSHRQK